MHKSLFGTLSLAGAALALLLAPGAGAFTYTDQDVLLVLRKPGNNDLVFNLGPVSTFLAVPNATTVAVANWDVEAARTTYGNLADGVKFAVLATTSREDAVRRAWLSVGEDETIPLDRTATQLQNVFAKIDSVGTKARVATATNEVQTFNVPSTANDSYTYVASNAGSALAQVPKLGGTSVFNVETDVPHTVRFAELHASSVIPKPEALIVGRFDFGADGSLHYTSGAGTVDPGPVVVATQVVIRPDASGVAIHFTGAAGTKYRLRYTDSAGLTSPFTDWTPGGASVDGAEGDLSLADGVAAPTRFYVVEAFR